jgi:ABC-type glycerol-3-phosphate transport system substrate-binding protein
VLDRRQFTTGVAASMISLSLSACQRQSTVRLIGEDSSNLKAIRRELEKLVLPGQPKILAEALDFNTALSQATADLAQRTGRYDLVLQYNFSLSPFVRNNYVYDIEGLKRSAPAVDYSFENDLLLNVWRELGFYLKPPFGDVHQVKPVAYPFCANTMVLVYNKKLLARPDIAAANAAAFGGDFGLPRTWEEFARAALLVTRTDPKLKGVVLQGATGGWLYYEWVNLLFGLGGKVMDKAYGWQSDLTTPLTLTSPIANHAVELYLSMKSANAGDFFSVDAVAQRDLMLAGDVAYAIMWTDYVPDIAKHAGSDFGFAPVPGVHSMIAGGSYFVSRQSKHVDLDAMLIAHLSSPAAQKRMALDGLLPPTRSALSDEQVLSIPYMPAVKASLERGIYMAEAGPDSDLIAQSITDALQGAWKGSIEPADVVSRAAAAIVSGRRKL